MADKILEFHFKVERLDKAVAYLPEGRVQVFSVLQTLDILTDKILVSPTEVRQLLKRVGVSI